MNINFRSPSPSASKSRPLLRRALSSSVALIVAASVAVALPAPASAASGPMGARTLGVTAVTLETSDSVRQAQIQSIKQNGFPAVRIPIQWPQVEAVQGVFNWAGTDKLVVDAYNAGLNILAVPTYTPTWAAIPEGRTFLHPGPADPATYANFTRLAAERYRGLIRNWEIWNEPNVIHSFAPKPDAAKYSQMLKLSYAAIKSVDQYSVVISGGLSPAIDDGTNISPARFVEALYANKAGASLDGIGNHPYSAPDLLSAGTDWWTPKNSIDMISYLMYINGDGWKKIWTTEFGAATTTGQPPYGVTEARQTEILVDGIKYLRSLPNGGPIFLFDYRDINTGSQNLEENYGLTRTNNTAKPSLAAVKALIN